jgi:hypothetical protein
MVTETCGRAGRPLFHETAFLELGDLADEAIGVGRGPRDRLEEPARFQQIAHQRRFLGSGAHGLEERIERGLIFLSGIGLERAPERCVLNATGGGKLIGVGG